MLTLGVVYKGIAIPILWEVLDKQGNSNQKERITLMQRFIRQFGQHNLSGLLGDRWEIETLFQCLKGRGFHWEETRLIKPNRIKKMIALLAIAFCWSHKIGEWKHKVIKPLQVKKHGRLEQSLFRYGRDYLTDFFIKQIKNTLDVAHLLMIFLFPPT